MTTSSADPSLPRGRLSPAALALTIGLACGLPCALILSLLAAVDARSFARICLLCMAGCATTGLAVGVARRFPVTVGAAVGLVAMAIAACFGPPFSAFLPAWMTVFGGVGFASGIAIGAFYRIVTGRFSSLAGPMRIERGRIDTIALFLAVPLLCIGGWFLCDFAWSFWSQRQLASALSFEQRGALAAFGKLGPYGLVVGSRELIDGETYACVGLSLRGRGIDDVKMRAIEGLHCPHVLLKLDLSENAITDAGLEPLSHLDTIQCLQLARTNVTDRGIAQLAGLNYLTTLDLVGTRVTQDCAKYLEQIPRLKKVYAAGTGLMRVKGVVVDREKLPETW